MFNHHQVNPSVPLSKKVMYDLFKQIPSHYPMRDGWRCVTMGGGVQSVLTPSPPPGVRRMLRWCVSSCDLVEPSTLYCNIRESMQHFQYCSIHHCNTMYFLLLGLLYPNKLAIITLTNNLV